MFSQHLFIVNSGVTLPYVTYNKKNLFRRCPWSARSPPPPPSEVGSLTFSEHLWCLDCTCSHQFCRKNSVYRSGCVHLENLKGFTGFYLVSVSVSRHRRFYSSQRKAISSTSLSSESYLYKQMELHKQKTFPL